MIKMEYTEGIYLKEKEINFKDTIDIISLKLLKNEKIKFIKLVAEIPSSTGIGLHNVTLWNKNNITCKWFNNNLIISDEKNSLSINEKANFTIRDRKNMSKSFDIFLKDYNMTFIIGY